MGSEGVSSYINKYASSSSNNALDSDHRQMLFNLKKLIEKWFLLRRDIIDDCTQIQEIFEEIQISICCILLDGLLQKVENQQSLLNELYWLHPCLPSNSTTNISKHDFMPSIYNWILVSLKNLSLCSKLQHFITDKELLQNYYTSTAFLCNETYTTALFICISSIELNQSSLLSQIDAISSCVTEKQIDIKFTKHRRSSSHPQFSISPKIYSISMSKSMQMNYKSSNHENTNDNNIQSNDNLKNSVASNSKQVVKNAEGKTNSRECLNVDQINFTKTSKVIKRLNSCCTLGQRSWCSLPDIRLNSVEHRPRSKTISQPIRIPNSKENLWEYNSRNRILSEFDFKVFKNKNDNNETKSNGNKRFEISSSPSSFELINDSENPLITATATVSEINDLRPIQLVKCDDIKIYFDQSYCNQEENYERNYENSVSTDLNSPSSNYYDSSSSGAESKNGLSNSLNFLSCVPTNLFTASDENLSKYSSNSPFYSRAGATSNTALSSSAISNDFVSSFLPQEGEKLKNFRSCSSNIMFDEEAIMPTYFDTIDYTQSLSNNGKSLAAFLQAAQFSRNNTDLERENAHFKISEAIIAIIENMKWAKIEQQLMQSRRNSLVQNDSSNTSNHQQNDINNMHCEKLIDESEIIKSPSLLHADKNQGTTSNRKNYDGDKNCNKIKTTHENIRLCNELNIEENYGVVENNDHTAYAEWGETNLEALSAEGVALSLISKFSDSQLPKPSDITWLVSEEDVKQELLPMPEDPAPNPDDYLVHSFTRGTRDWAPPRQQIIFTDHPTPNRKIHLQKQKYRCAGCGMKVALMYSHRFRYCTYLGKYLCTGCHRDQISIIPAKVLNKWDFTYYPVCVFSYRLLEQMWTYPLFYVPDLNPLLYCKIKSLYTAKLRRIQLKYIRDFINSCRFADKEKKIFENIPTHLTVEPDKWAMSDFVAVKNGHLQKYIADLIKNAEEHVFNCMLCTAHGFICEICSKDQVIYPWQSKIKRCDNCGTCFHLKCGTLKPDCVKCQRLRKRQQLS